MGVVLGQDYRALLRSSQGGTGPDLRMGNPASRPLSCFQTVWASANQYTALGFSCLLCLNAAEVMLSISVRFYYLQSPAT